MPCRTPLTVKILQSYYPNVGLLQDYLVTILDPSFFQRTENDKEEFSCYILREGDPEEYEQLVRTSWVGSAGSLDDVQGTIEVHPSLSSMAEIINYAQTNLFIKSGGRPSNVLTVGYRMAENKGEQGEKKGGRHHLVNYFVNTLLTALQAREWNMLLERIGEAAILHLLTETSIFVSLPNYSLCQLTGSPLTHLKPDDQNMLNWAMQPVPSLLGKRRRPLTDGTSSKPKGKKDAIPNEKNKARKAWRLNLGPTPIEISFERSRLLYSRAVYARTTNDIIVGLPPTHILNEAPKQYGKGDTRLDEDWIRRLSKHIFPRQYGLRSVFSSRDYISHADRTKDVQTLGKCKTPKRLRHVMALLGELQRKHLKCPYKVLFDTICPSRVTSHKSTSISKEVLLEILSEDHTSTLIATQAAEISQFSFESRHSNVSRDFSTMREARVKPRFAEFALTTTQIFRYVKLILKLVVPAELWGCQNNMRIVLKHIKTYITSRRYETLSLHSVLQGLSTTECDWLLPPFPSKSHRASVGESLKRRELLEEILHWIFEGFLLPLLKTSFYITDSQAFRNRLLFFRQDDWAILCEPLLNRLADETFVKLTKSEVEETFKDRKLGFSFVRLLPKESGVRPIVNLRRKLKSATELMGRTQSINQVLQATFHILTYEKEMQPHLFGASTFGPNEIYQKFKQFKMNLRREANGDLPRLYFVKVDVQACFDTIAQPKLLHILRHLISEDGYMIQKYNQIASVAGRIRKTYERKACPESEHPHFLALARKLASLLRHRIFVDQVIYPFAYRDEILRLLEEHISVNVVKIDQNYYRQVIGIPQGSVLSSLLCSFFYGDLERTKLRFALDDPESMLLRLIDDYLFITTDQAKAQHFLNVMKRGHPEYGCFISKKKTLINFESDSNDIESCAQQVQFPWCGYLINTIDLSIMMDFARLNRTYIPDSLSVYRGKNIGKMFLLKMIQSSKHKLHIIFYDIDHNSSIVVYKNIFHNFIFSAMRLHHYHHTLKSEGFNSDSKLLKRIINQMIYHVYSGLRSNTLHWDVNYSIEKRIVCWLGFTAFYLVLRLKAKHYTLLIVYLQQELKQLRRIKGKGKLNLMMNEVWKEMSTFVF